MESKNAKFFANFFENDVISKSDQYRNLVFDDDHAESTHKLESRLLIVSDKHPNWVNVEQVVNKESRQVGNDLIDLVVHVGK